MNERYQMALRDACALIENLEYNFRGSKGLSLELKAYKMDAASLLVTAFVLEYNDVIARACLLPKTTSDATEEHEQG